MAQQRMRGQETGAHTVSSHSGPVDHAHTENTVSSPQPTSLAHDIAMLLLKIGIIVVAVIAVFTFVFGALRYNDASMKPNIKDGDLLLYYRLGKDYSAGDVLVYDYEGKTICARVVAVGGDTVDIDDDGLKVNGSYQQESEVYTETTQFEGGVTLPLTVPEGQIFVLGDNRSAATDSRIIGCIDEKDTKGQLICLLRRRGL